jgi:glutamate-ammonia-ligase adenylyltransferase
LGDRQLLPAAAVGELRAAYVFLRNLEHRLQYLEDKQTQSLPRDPEDCAAIAEMMNFPDYDELGTALASHRAAVSRHFEAIFAGARDNSAAQAHSELWLQALPEEEARARLAGLGYVAPAIVCGRLSEMRSSSRYRRMSASGQALLDRLVPMLLETAATFHNGDATFERTLKVVESIGRRESYLALLLEYPNALGNLARLASASPWAADYLAQHPVLLDDLITPQAGDTPDWPRLRTALRASLDENEGNTERQMDLLRFPNADTGCWR